MDNQYIKEFIQKLEETEIWKGDTEKCEGYDEGINLLVDTFVQCKKNYSQVYFVGNGGSAAIAIHMVTDFMNNGGMKTGSLYNGAVMTGIGNDYGYEHVFSRQLEFLAGENDLLVAISSSGNSRNIVNAIEAAKKKGAKTITFTGFKKNNKAKQMGNVNIYVPCEKYGIVESIHNLILQQIVDIIKG